MLYVCSIPAIMKRPGIFCRKGLSRSLKILQITSRSNLYRVDDIDQVPEPDAEPDNQDYAGLQAADLLEIIRELPPKYRMVFNLYAIEGYSHKEISEMINISEGTSKSNLSRARAILQRRVGSFTGIKKRVANE
jgi:RNA polymerase sigma-70 factor (ECF subfamily)